MVDPAAALQKSDNRTPAFISDLNIRRGAEPPGGCPSFEMNWAMMGAMVSTHHNLVGLARVSAIVQDAPLQSDALTAAGCGRIFEEKVSARSAARPELAAALDYLRPDNGDVLAVWKLDRLRRWHRLRRLGRGMGGHRRVVTGKWRPGDRPGEPRWRDRRGSDRGPRPGDAPPHRHERFHSGRLRRLHLGMASRHRAAASR